MSTKLLDMFRRHTEQQKKRILIRVSTLEPTPANPSLRHNGQHNCYIGNSNLALEANEVQSSQSVCYPGSDRLVRVQLLEHHFGTDVNDGTNVLSDQASFLLKCSKFDYSNIDSITFVAVLLVNPNGPGKASVQLHNWTDNVAISNSHL